MWQLAPVYPTIGVITDIGSWMVGTWLFADHESQAARSAVNTWMGDRLANIDL